MDPWPGHDGYADACDLTEVVRTDPTGKTGHLY